MSGRWIKDGFITYGSRDWHYFPLKGKISACSTVLPHQRGWDSGVADLPDTSTKMNTCLVCKKYADKNSNKNLPSQPVIKSTCGKKEYFTQAEADLSMIKMKKRNGIVRKEARSYFCAQCQLWHLTSQAKNA